MDWKKFFEENLIVILLGVFLVVLSLLLFIPTNSDKIQTNSTTNEIVNVDNSNNVAPIIKEPKIKQPPIDLPPEKPRNYVDNPDQLCADMCRFRDSSAREVKNIDGVLTCICANDFERVLGLAK